MSSSNTQTLIKDLLREFSKSSASIEMVGKLLDQLFPQLLPLDLSNPNNPEMRQVLEIACFHAAYTFGYDIDSDRNRHCPSSTFNIKIDFPHSPCASQRFL